MISQRTSGLYHLVVLVQCLLISILYWVLVTTFYFYHTSFSIEGYRQFAIPYAFASSGSLRRRHCARTRSQLTAQGHLRHPPRSIPPDPLRHGAAFRLLPHRPSPAARLALRRRLFLAELSPSPAHPLALARGHHQVRLQRFPGRAHAHRGHTRESLRAGPLSCA